MFFEILGFPLRISKVEFFSVANIREINGQGETYIIKSVNFLNNFAYVLHEMVVFF